MAFDADSHWPPLSIGVDGDSSLENSLEHLLGIDGDGYGARLARLHRLFGIGGLRTMAARLHLLYHQGLLSCIGESHLPGHLRAIILNTLEVDY